MSLDHKLRMTIQPKVIDHLGINLYTNLHSVISELIANSWDACAKSVYILIPEGTPNDSSEIIISDDGNGMTFTEINDKYLQVGRNRRKDEKSQVVCGDRNVLGRKGIGKFSVFGVSNIVSIRSVKNGKATEFIMDIDKIKNNTGKKDYEPDIIDDEVDTKEPNGVTVKLHQLKRKRAVAIDELRAGIASRFLLLNKDFKVFMNEKPVTTEDRKIWDDVEFSYEIDEPVSAEHPNWRIKGTIWSKKGTIREEHNRGMAVFARGRLVQEPTFFGATSGKEFAYPHLYGEINADFIDEESDTTSTDRSAINLESEEGAALKEWGHNKLTEISKQWSDDRVAKREPLLLENEEVKKWLKELTKPEQKTAKSILSAITRNTNLSEEQMLAFYRYIRDTFEYRAFHDLADQITSHSPDEIPLIIDLFKQWEHVESREMYKILSGRIAGIKKLRQLVASNARENPEMHEFLSRFPWVLNPKWTIVEDESSYSTILKNHFNEKEVPKENKRIDFLCFSSWGEFIVIELKRPGHAVGKKDLDQLRDYVLFIKDKIKPNPNFATKPVYGYMICQELQKASEITTMIEDMRGSNRFVLRYTDLADYAEKLHQEFIGKYDEIQKKIDVI